MNRKSFCRACHVAKYDIKTRVAVEHTCGKNFRFEGSFDDRVKEHRRHLSREEFDRALAYLNDDEMAKKEQETWKVINLQEKVKYLGQWIIDNPTAPADSMQEVMQRLREYNEQLNNLLNKQQNGND